jgi:hypothetical protein
MTGLLEISLARAAEHEDLLARASATHRKSPTITLACDNLVLNDLAGEGQYENPGDNRFPGLPY